MCRLGFRRVELFKQERGRRHIKRLHVVTHGLDHRGRATQVNIGRAIPQVGGGQVVGGKAFQRMIRVGVGHDGCDGQRGDQRCQRLQAVHLDQIGQLGDRIDQTDRLIGSGGCDQFQHRQEGRKAGATGQKHLRAGDRAQIKRAHGAGQRHRVASLRAGQIARHQPAGDIADQERRLIGLWVAGEGISAGLVGAGDLHIDVLTGKKAHPRRQFHPQPIRCIRQRLDPRDGGLHRLCAGLAGKRRGGNCDHAIGFRHHLAGQHHACGGLFLGHRVFKVEAKLIVAPLGLALAGAANPVAAIHRHVDLLPKGGVGDFFIGFAVDDAGDAVFEVQGDLVGHGSSSPRRASSSGAAPGVPSGTALGCVRCGRRRSHGGCGRSSGSPFSR